MNRSRILRAALVAPALTLALAAGGASMAYADTTVSAKAPVFVDQAGTENDSYIVPEVAGVNYYVDSVKVNSGTRQVNAAKPFVEVFTAAAPGFTLAESATWSHQFKSDNTVEIIWNGTKYDSVQAALDAQAGRATQTTTTTTGATTTTGTATTTGTTTTTGVTTEASIAACQSTTRRNIPRGDPDYSSERDPNNNGVACETATTATTTRKGDELPPTGIEDALPLAGVTLLAAFGGGLLLRRKSGAQAA